jgi:hypothetical protein
MSIFLSISVYPTFDPDYQIGRVPAFEDRLVNIAEFKFDLPLLNAAESFTGRKNFEHVFYQRRFYPIMLCQKQYRRR